MDDFKTPPNSHIVGDICPPLRRLRYIGMKTVSKEKRPNPVPTKMPKLSRAVSLGGGSSLATHVGILDQEEVIQASQSLERDDVEWQDSQVVDDGEDVSTDVCLRSFMIIQIPRVLRFRLFSFLFSLRKTKRTYALSYECHFFVHRRGENSYFGAVDLSTKVTYGCLG